VSMMLLAAMMMAQAPSQSPAQPAPAKQAAKKEKPKQICELIEVTGSRSKRRVCRDEDGNLDLGPGVHGGGTNTNVPSVSTGNPGGSN
jgi:hypothetical protein